MAIYKKGADPVALRLSAGRFIGHARECEAVRGETARAIRALGAEWGGADHDHLLARWTPAEARLGQLGSDLAQLAEALRRNAGEQSTTSGGGGGVPAGAAHTSATGRDINGDGVVSDAERAALARAAWLRFLGIDAGPELIHSGQGLPWTPQGQGYDEGRSQILTSYYGDDGVLLSLQDKDTGYEVGNVILGGDEAHGDPTKGGGVATDGDKVYLADTGQVYVYDRSAIDAATDGDTVDPVQVNDVDAGSYIAVNDNQAYVGRFAQNLTGPFGDDDAEPELYRYDINSDGTFGDVSGPVRTPYNAQGVAVTDGGLLYSTSYSDKPGLSPHNLVYQTFNDKGSFDVDSDLDDVQEIPYYGEAVNVIDGQAWVTHESSAAKYQGDEGISSIQRYDLDDLGR